MGSLFPSHTGPDRDVSEGRETMDAYWTPYAAALACCRVIADIDPGPAPLTVLEPCAGGGSWVRAAHEVWGAQVDRVDIDPEAPGLLQQLREGERAVVQDYLEPPGLQPLREGERPWDLVVGNPPYGGDVTAWVERSIGNARMTGFLLRSTFLGSIERSAWWQRWPPACVWTLAPRPRWGGPGARESSDTCDSVFVLWVRGQPDTRLRWLRWTP